MQEINLYRQTPYALQPVPQLQSLIWSLATDTDDALYEKSIQLEPRRK